MGGQPGTPTPTPTPTPAPPVVVVDWDPETHGFTRPADAQIETVDGKRYYDRITKRAGETDLTFRLIKRIRPVDPPTVYRMENKVPNGPFKAASDDDQFKELLAEYQKKYPTMKWGEWRLGGIRSSTEDVGSTNDALPVLRVNAMEAYSFAVWLGGNL